MEDPESTTCASIRACLAIIGDKWTGLIIQDISTGSTRFSQIEQHLSIGPRTLSQRLDNLEMQGIVTKKQYAEAPPRVEYTLTKKGKDLLPILDAMATWTSEYPVA